MKQLPNLFVFMRPRNRESVRFYASNIAPVYLRLATFIGEIARPHTFIGIVTVVVAPMLPRNLGSASGVGLPLNGFIPLAGTFASAWLDRRSRSWRGRSRRLRDYWCALVNSIVGSYVT